MENKNKTLARKILSEKEEARDKKLLLLMEMANMKPERTGLPMTVWLDDGKYYTKSGHWKRIKFQNHKGDANSYDFSTMTISDNPVIIGNNSIEWTSKEMNILKQWLIDNKLILEKLADTEIDIIEFMELQKKSE